jgi:type 1 fimbriae regulatory protein FimB/type 1 fimbriae regulatory protein FimE
MVASNALAQAYPTKTVRLIDGFAPGGSTDIVGRLITQKLADSLGQPFVVENRPGASGIIATDMVAKVPPDGHIILIVPLTFTVNPSLDSAGKLGRHGARDAAILTLAYRHGLRASELVALRWDMVDLRQGLLHITRLKNGIASVHPLRGPELRALRKLERDYPDTQYVFVTERKGPLTTDTVRKLIARAGKAAGLAFPVHPHMLRHACGYKLANDGQDTRAIQHYLGHRNIQHTVRYTELSPARFKDFWRD